LRWALLDQRRRCPVCLRLLAKLPCVVHVVHCSPRLMVCGTWRRTPAVRDASTLMPMIPRAKRCSFGTPRLSPATAPILGPSRIFHWALQSVKSSPDANVFCW
jgi:hypothetical protein